MDEWIYEYVDAWMNGWIDIASALVISFWWVGHRLGAADAATRKMLTDATDVVLIFLIPTQRPVPGAPGPGLGGGGFGVCLFFSEIDALKLKFPRSTHDFCSLKSSRHTWERFWEPWEKAYGSCNRRERRRGPPQCLFVYLFVCVCVFFFKICEVGGMVSWRSCTKKDLFY